MALRITAPTKKEFILERTDAAIPTEGGPTTITVRQATQGDNELRNELFAKFQREYNNEGGVKVTQDISFDAIRRREVYLTLCSTNIAAEDGSALFKFNSNGRLTDEVAFRRAWSLLESITADEIHEKVLEMNPNWRSDGGEGL
jgi:hypothetical protein